ncbi:LPXTG cell wall anchor domain-containing protein [Salegentibacter salegens]|uniref:LPXTG-motif cell wall anchor domain-containing protein n=1 Tax=Salegentibacter salegens TaxID=143223 RepID=A0A1M7M6M7_9FLAO|nr:LPXTG cell wall anchor domain-containing protein [Salegentibacter salegens]PRX40804.1 LPXTG-motif cell wall-anchored protein [Salegentibacter salegens]SHM85900.1 LPXTG-motif cell wall anchor domain-containing protein [Salegentibacter salegens]
MNNRLTTTLNIYKAAALLLFLLLSFQAFAQEPQINAKIDSSSIKIGEQIIFSIEVETDSTNLVVFPEGQTFDPMEMVESLGSDTTTVEGRFRLLKKYSLTQFDSGAYTIPQQKIIIQNREYLTDSFRVEVADVKVDTTRQKMYPIKPAVDVPKPFSIPNWVWWLLAILALIGLAFYFFKRRKKRKEAEPELPPYEQAMFELKQLDNSSLLQDREIKEYYSQLTFIVRKYLDRKIYDRALESTTSDLIAYLELKKQAGELSLKDKSIDNLQQLLRRADLAKFANSRPDVITAKSDRTKVEHLIKDIRQVVPEPTEEELMQDENYRREILLKRRKRRIIAVIGGILILGIIVVAILVNTKGFGFVKDSVFGNETKELLEGDWIKSEYGTPTVTITTPEVLMRHDVKRGDELQEMLLGSETFDSGTLEGNLYILLITGPVNPQGDFDLEKAVDGIYENLESQGARNIIMKEEEFSTINNAKGIKVFGTFDLENPITGGPIKKEYAILNFGENSGFQQVMVVFDEDDEYAEEILQRVENSIELRNQSN